jgi:hypothetical protein
MRELLGDPEAHRLLRRAYGSTYRWPPGFGGFRASVYYAHDEEFRAGSLEVRAPLDMRFWESMQGADDRLEQELLSLLVCRWHLSYEEADGQHRLAVDDDEHPLGRLVSVDDGMGSSYRVRGDCIQQVNRTVEGIRFSVQIQERAFTRDGRTLPFHFCVSHWDLGQERLVRTEVYRDGYVTVGDVYLPSSRRIITAEDSGITTRQILLRDHQLLVEGRAEGKAVRSGGPELRRATGHRRSEEAGV